MKKLFLILMLISGMGWADCWQLEDGTWSGCTQTEINARAGLDISPAFKARIKSLEDRVKKLEEKQKYAVCSDSTSFHACEEQK